MVNALSILPQPAKDQESFILDHGKIVDGALKYKDDFTSYSWNVKRFNRLHVGAFVLGRRPGKLTKDRKFEIYSGGVVSHISDPDSEGNVVATIDRPFRIIPPIRQGDDFIETFKWDSKQKKEDTWEHFWNQYGMNKISFKDFKNLVEHVNCLPLSEDLVPIEADLSENEILKIQTNKNAGFNITFENEGKNRSKNRNKYSGIAKKLDFEKIQKAKSKIGALGEEIVFDYLMESAQQEGLATPVHVSIEEGDGLGYDIRYWDKDGKEIHVEVKTTTSSYVDGFEMTRNEIEASLNTNYEYQIYRVYDLQLKTKDCKIKIYKGPIDDKRFMIETTKVVVYKK